MARIFISYSRADRQFIDQFIPLIRRVYGNDSVWFDDDIHGGVDWWQMILHEIDKCDIFVYLISNESLESPYCQAELREALRLNKQILPVIVRRLNPVYPGNIEDDLAVVLRRTQYVDMSGGFKNEANNARIWGTINQLMIGAPQEPLNPITLIPTPEPPVPDKARSKGKDYTVQLLIGLFVTIVGGLILAMILRTLDSDGIDTSTPTNNETSVALVDTETPTLSGFQVLQTTEAELTQSAGTQAAFELTLTEQFISDSNATATAAQFAATETAAYATLLALSATPTETPHPTATNTPDPMQAAFTPVTRNADWTPIEREFDGIMMVLVPAGCFMMGSTQEQVDAAVAAGLSRSIAERELPQHEQCFDEPFWIGQTEVTNAQYAEFIDAGGYDNPDYWTDAGWSRRQSSSWTQPGRWTDSNFNGANQPVVSVSWYEAMAYAEWRGCRLPTEAEWEYAARGPDGLIYPWGDEFVADNLVYSGNSNNRTANVGSRPGGASWVGALDMAGNVWNWTLSEFADYPYSAEDGRENINSSAARVVRGGSFISNNNIARAANRNVNRPDLRSNLGGLRLVCVPSS